MKQKILFFDIDGTLIDEETDVVPESAKKALAAAKEKGICFLSARGAVWRSFHKMSWNWDLMD